MHASPRYVWPIGGAVCVLAVAAAVLLYLLAGTVTNQAVRAPGYKPVLPPPLPYTFPSGGRTLFPDYQLVALYGTPDAPALGALGQQPLADTITRVQALAAQYQPYAKAHVLPALEIITTIASSTPTSNNDYSRELPPDAIMPWIVAARAAGMYVVLDLQSGRSDFLTQAKEYRQLLQQPNVGLALDPEWRLTPTEVPLVQIGTVDAAEINSVSSWLAGLTAQAKLPQKLFMLQEFRTSMITNRQNLATGYPQLAYVIQMDGQGTQAQKLGSWQAVLANPPANVSFGWKNFYAKDTTVLTPAQTMALSPQPRYVSYQ